VTISGIGYTDADPSNNSAQDSDPIVGVANLSITKSNGGTTITTGSTTSYTVTVANGGPAVVTNAVLLDPTAFGLSCTAVTCTSVIGAATCPTAAATTIGALQVGGITLPSMGVPSSIIFRVDCSVTATGQ
jgi:trimeric autotransporter adhesin